MVELVVPEWSPSVLRYGVVGLVAPPGLGKFLAYGDSVAFFTALGIPAPRVAVLLVGVVELGTVALLALDEWRRVATLALLPVMIVAVWTVGEWQALAVLGAVIALLAVEVGALTAEGSTPTLRRAEDGTS